MKKFIVVSLIISFLGTVAYYLLIIFIIGRVVESSVQAYEKPDTTITVHNGKPDTVIVKKQATSIFK